MDEGLRLMQMSKFSLYEDKDAPRGAEDPISAIYGRIREDILLNKKETFSWDEVVALCGNYTVSGICEPHKKCCSTAQNRSLLAFNTGHQDFKAPTA